MNEYTILNILDMIDAIGEDQTQAILSDFSCSKNTEIETFIRHNAVNFAKQKLSITYLIFDEAGMIPGIFTLTHKAIDISTNGLSKTTAKKIGKYSELDEEEKLYQLSAFLIAQFGKSDEANQSFTGEDLMGATLGILSKIQHDIGGGVIYLECEDKDKLLDFYQKCGFKPFGERIAKMENVKYIQLLKVF